MQGGNKRCAPSAGSYFLSTAPISKVVTREEAKGSQDNFNRKKIALAGMAVAWNSVSLDGAKYKI